MITLYFLIIIFQFFYYCFTQLETLLKNHYQMFQIYDKDKVRLKIWTKDNPHEAIEIESDKIACGSNSKCLKTNPCLSDLYHPDGCLLSDLTCTYFRKKMISTLFF
jgi:hypothetical protein